MDKNGNKLIAGNVVAANSIHDLLLLTACLPVREQEIFRRLFDVRHESLSCSGTHRITRIRNRWLGDATSFDERRTRRFPSSDKLKLLSEKCRPDDTCSFCSTSSSPLQASRPGATRLGSCTCFSPNVRFTSRHCLLVPDEHDPFCLEHDVLRDMFDCGSAWVERMLDDAKHQAALPPSHYFIGWNILCGSIAHGHSQATLVSDFAEGGIQNLRDRSLDYELTFRSKLLTDLIHIHDRLGLALQLDESRWLCLAHTGAA